MNGQTGKLVGDLPVSWGKFWGMFAGIAALLSIVGSIGATLTHDVTGGTDMKRRMTALLTALSGADPLCVPCPGGDGVRRVL